MLLKIAYDTPPQLIDIARKCNFGVIQDKDKKMYLTQLSTLASKYIPRKKEMQNVAYNTIEMGNCPKELANLINEMDFAKINSLQRAIAIPYIKSYLSNMGILK